MADAADASASAAAAPEVGSVADATAGKDATKQLLDDLQAAFASGPTDPSSASKAAVGAKRDRSPVKLGYKDFCDAKQCTDYFRDLLASAVKGVDFNEYEYLALLELLQKGHPKSADKIGCGLKGFQVRSYPGADESSRAFYAVRKDGSAEDFSYLKCAAALFPGEVYVSGGGGSRHHKGDGGMSPRGRGGRGGRFGRGGRGRGGGRRG